MDLPRRTRRERGLLLLTTLGLAAWGLGSRWDELGDIRAQEGQRLAMQVHAVEQNLGQQLQGMQAALRGLRSDLSGRDGGDDLERTSQHISQRISQRMEALCAAIAGVRSMEMVDAQGVVRAAGGARTPRAQATAGPWLAAVRARPDPAVLFVSAPFGTAGSELSINLSVALTGPQGEFRGAIAATLDPAYFNTLLGSVLYASDMRATIVHADGGVLVINPADAQRMSQSVAGPGSLFSRHLASGRAATLQTGVTALSGDERMVAQRTLQPPYLAMDKALVLGVSRNVKAMLAPWQRQTELEAGLYIAVTVAAWAALLGMQRRRSERERAAAERQAREAADAERLRLALHGGDLALWDVHLPTLQATINERWSSMLGYALHEVTPQNTHWESLLHPEDQGRVLALQQAHLEGLSPQFEATYRLRHKEGHWIWVLDRGRVVERGADGTPLRMVGTHMDVTAQVQAEETLRRSEQNLAITLQSIGDAVIATDAQGRITRVNDAARRLTQWADDSAIGQPLGAVFRIFNADTREPELDPVARVLASGNTVGLANGTLLVARDGTEFQIADSAAPIRTPEGEIAGVVLVFSDVTEQYQMVQALRRSEHKSRALLDALSSGVVVHAADTQIVEANPAACRMLGLSLDQLRGKLAIDPAWAFLEEDGSAMPVSRFPANQVLALGEPLRNLVVGLRRSEMPHTTWVLCNAFGLHDGAGAVQQVVVTFSDFSERKLAEEALQRSAARLRQASRLARLGGWQLDLASGQLWLSPETIDLLEADAQTALTLETALPLVAPQHRGPLQQALQGGVTFDLELDANTLRGRPLHLRVLGEPVPDSQGRAVAMQGAMQDVTESRREQQQLRLLEAAVARLNDVVLITEAEPLDEPGPRIVFANPAFERLTGWRREEVLGRSARMLQSSQTDPAELLRIRSALQRHEAVGAELLNVGRNGLAYWVEVQVVPLVNAQGRMTHLVAVQRDITERRRSEDERRVLERQLREAQKMESIGTLAGGIAHDFNNILAAILGNVALASQDLHAGHAALDSLDQIRRASLRARSLVQQILTFSRRQPQELVGQPLQPVLEETLSLLRATLPAGVQLDTVLASEALAVEADATQLQQVVMNLCTNAWHALPGGRGRIEVGLAALDAEAALRLDAGLAGRERPAGPCAHLWVRDNGSGMEAALVERIFDPFFTTKPVGQGTGLGLSVVHGIVRGHRGSITVDSTPGVGTTFHVMLPLVSAAPALAGLPLGAASVSASLSLSASAPGVGQTVLYVDDDEVMGLMVQRLLERAGYAVTVCLSPEQALAWVQAQPQAFNVVVSDFNMPQMSGAQLAAQLLRLRPGLPIIISSGFITDDLRIEALRLGVRALLKKEQTLEGLVDLVQQVLSQPGS